MPKRFVYVLKSESGAHFYVGLAADPAARLAAHNAGESPHTSKFRPWRAVVTLEFDTEDRAVTFERYLKSGSGRAFAKRHFG
jgi:predicted GIY-YIG superfamily endonuclease